MYSRYWKFCLKQDGRGPNKLLSELTSSVIMDESDNFDKVKKDTDIHM